MNTKEKLFLAFLGSGLLPKAPGTWGSLAGLLVGMAILAYFPIETLFLSTVLITLFGVKAIDAYEARTGRHDDSRIVIDEVAGIWLALCLSTAQPLAALSSFLFFRLYDITKPSIVGRIDRDVSGGWGVMGDDLVAGVLAGLSSALLMLVLSYLGVKV